MGDLFHDPAVDLLHTGLAVDDHIVKAPGQKADDLFQVAVDLAVAAGAFRAANGEKGEAPALGDGVENLAAGLSQQLHSGLGIPLPGLSDHGLADVVYRQAYLHAQGGGQAYGGVCVYGQNALARVHLAQQPYHSGGNGGFAHAALSGNGQNCGFSLFHRSLLYMQVLFYHRCDSAVIRFYSQIIQKLQP